MTGSLRAHLCVLLLSVTALRGRGRYIDVQENEISAEGLFSLLNSELKRESPDLYLYRRPLKCLDMVAVEGQFTFTADRPQLNCAAFFIGEPTDIISIEYDSVNINCRGGDFIKVFDGWVMKGEKFPSSQDHPLPLYERYSDYCDSGEAQPIVRSSQNVAMVFFRLHQSGSSFTITFRKVLNPFPCNVISQTPEGRFSMVIPQQHRNCSYSIIYPVEIQIGELSLGHHNDLKRSVPGCAGAGDFVELLGGNGVDTSKMFPMADLCYSFNGPAQLKVGCDNTVVRMVSSGKFVNRVTFQYRLLDHQELQKLKGNSVEDLCLSG
ncbi:corticotropin-releasing factor-binding protein [Pygocentrus nattereri]|uniref:Corticotropin-releasing factor-binding protein n=1 Tax=Pygocentrus nattereri TaxID=42514 RepID=A0A3B4E6U0_PYGNA|nr:corticotropin-releasing factor-binding protein [Pygocentrus nattereri]